MNELIKLVADKAGISPQQAERAVTTVFGFLRDKLPAPVVGQLEHFIGGSGGAADEGGRAVDGGLGLGAVEGVLGGLFGKK